MPDVVFQELDGEVLLLLPGQQGVLHLNETASALWELLEEDTSEDEIVALLARAYAQEPELIRGDIGPIVEQLVEQGVVQRT